jgi:hypothetical protein
MLYVLILPAHVEAVEPVLPNHDMHIVLRDFQRGNLHAAENKPWREACPSCAENYHCLPWTTRLLIQDTRQRAVIGVTTPRLDLAKF